MLFSLDDTHHDDCRTTHAVVCWNAAWNMLLIAGDIFRHRVLAVLALDRHNANARITITALFFSLALSKGH
jgi:hypothetical protein